jgi:hypothetical protein
MNIASRLKALLVAALALVPCGARAAGKPAPPAQEAPPPKSAFAIDPQVGKDPFFPKSTRLQAVPVKTPDPVMSNLTQFPDEVRCQGGSNQREKRLAIVNGKTVEKGENFELHIRGQRLAVRCLDVTEKTVLLEINGISKELRIPGTPPGQP